MNAFCSARHPIVMNGLSKDLASVLAYFVRTPLFTLKEQGCVAATVSFGRRSGPPAGRLSQDLGPI